MGVVQYCILGLASVGAYMKLKIIYPAYITNYAETNIIYE